MATHEITMVDDNSSHYIKARSVEQIRVTGRHVHNNGWHMSVELFHSNPACCTDGPKLGEHMHLSADVVVLADHTKYGKPAPVTRFDARPGDDLVIYGKLWRIVACRFRDPLLFEVATLPDPASWPWPMVAPVVQGL